ncbi:hypothetical protein TanjilG_31972 [Lupinus angustifolius]|uniref:Uncharacterized protein n=2 Tax=Lupinus angustifolius TaxID=3871 RepID=A0A394D9W2_LUPAN|nr:hypothetical protein TanjilG_31972 [Lupinus angustifolius]
MAKEILLDQEAKNYEESTLLQDPYEEDQEETLSLCDLPNYSSDSAQWDDYFSKQGQSSSHSNDDDEDELFEFFSEEFTTPTPVTTAKNIIFCGKLIPFKEPRQQQHVTNTCDKPKPLSRTSGAKGSKNNMCDYASIKKVSLMRSTTKSRWHLFMFGSRVSTEMELSDIRSRQNRKVPATMIPASEQGKEMMKNKGKMKNTKGLWRILKSLEFGCLSSTIVKASFVE